MAVDLTRALSLIVGLGAGVAVLDVRGRRGGPLEVEIELTRRPRCGGCSGKVWVHGSSKVKMADLAAFGRPVRLVWNKHRWRCPHEGCPVGTFTDQEPAIAPPRGRVTARAARWATRRAGKGRAIKEIAAELGCNWHTAMAAVGPGAAGSRRLAHRRGDRFGARRDLDVPPRPIPRQALGHHDRRRPKRQAARHSPRQEG